MAAPYSIDLRLKAVRAYENGKNSQQETAKIFGMGIATFARYWKQYKETGDVAITEYKRGRKPVINEKQLSRIKNLVINRPDISLGELCQKCNQGRAKKIGITVMFRAICKLGFKRKKKSLYAAQQDTEEVKKTEKNS
jgi:transposase